MNALWKKIIKKQAWHANLVYSEDCSNWYHKVADFHLDFINLQLPTDMQQRTVKTCAHSPINIQISHIHSSVEV